MCSHCFIYVGWQLLCVRLHMICVHSSVCVNSQFHLVGWSLFVVVYGMLVIIFQFVSVCVSVFSCWLSHCPVVFICYRSVSMFPVVLWFSVFIACVLYVFHFLVFNVCFQFLVVFSSCVFSVFFTCVCVCVPHGCGIYVYDVIRDQYMFMCEHVSCCVHVCVLWVMVCCGCICFWCMWCHVCGHALWCKYTAIKLNNSTLTLSNILIQQPSTFTIGSRWLSCQVDLSC